MGKADEPAADELLPCPCCGNSPVRRPYMAVIDDYGNKSETGVVFCTGCGLNLETGCGQVEAEMRWNRRGQRGERRNIEFRGHGWSPIEQANR